MRDRESIERYICRSGEACTRLHRYCRPERSSVSESIIKLLASGTELTSDAAATVPAEKKLTFAEKMMAKQGWVKGEGLGKKGSGITEAIQAEERFGRAVSTVPRRDGVPLQLPLIAPMPTVCLPEATLVCTSQGAQGLGSCVHSQALD